MKKTILIGTFILSLVITFLFAEIFSLYHFGDSPTITTFLYLISLFSILEYFFLVITYIFNKKLNKEKIKNKNVISMILFFISLILFLGFIVILNIDWLTYYSNPPTPVYVIIIKRSLEFLLPSIILMIIGIFIVRKK